LCFPFFSSVFVDKAEEKTKNRTLSAKMQTQISFLRLLAHAQSIIPLFGEYVELKEILGFP